MEIERKFIIKDIDKVKELIKNFEKNKKIITQDYLYVDSFTAIRKRKIEQNNIEKYIYTVKTFKTGISVNELEKELSINEYKNLRINSNNITLIKDRYVIPYTDNLEIELDIFHGLYEGIVFAEIEFASEEQAYNTKLPEWFGEEISDKITNSQMAIDDCREILK